MEDKELLEKLEKMFNEMNDWEKKPIVKSGRIVIELIKLPEKKSKNTVKPSSLALMIRREDAFRGLLIESDEEIEDLLTALSVEKVKKIARAIREINRRKALKEFEI